SENSASPRRPSVRPEPVFLADCVRLDAVLLLARTRGARLVGDDGSHGNLSTQWTIRWTEDGREQQRTVTLLHGHAAASRRRPPLAVVPCGPAALPRAHRHRADGDDRLPDLPPGALLG